MKIIVSTLVLFAVLGCQRFSNRPLLSDASSPKKAQNRFDPHEVCKTHECLVKKGNYFYEQCKRGEGEPTACYKHGLVREKRGDHYKSVFESFNWGCEAGIRESCKALQRSLKNYCVGYRTNYDNEPECYKDGPVKRLSAGSSVQEKVRLNNDLCNRKLKKAEEGCPLLGSFEAKRGNYEKAAQIFKEGCTGPQKSDSCDELVCIGWYKYSRGIFSEAKAIFDTTCTNTKNNAIRGSGGTYDGCHSLRSRYSNESKEAYIEKMQALAERKFSSCKKRWQNGWGPIR